jgi:class III poly(R)-hydroxyalkanoic acid synthase PhaE subunit
MSDPDSSQAQALPYLKAWNDYVAACQTLFERLSDGSAAHSGAMPLPFLGPWKDFAANLGLRADFAGQQFKPEDLFARHLPALGLSREYQEIVRRMLDVGERFQRRCADFAQAGADIGQSAWAAIHKRSSGDATLLGSPAALYDAWIDCAEEAFARAAHGEPFARLLADLCNLLSEFKLERGKLLEALARHLDLPSRAEVDSLHRQVRELTVKAKAAATSPAAKTKTRTKEKAKASGRTAAQSKPPAGTARPPRAAARKRRAAK